MSCRGIRAVDHSGLTVTPKGEKSPRCQPRRPRPGLKPNPEEGQDQRKARGHLQVQVYTAGLHFFHSNHKLLLSNSFPNHSYCSSLELAPNFSPHLSLLPVTTETSAILHLVQTTNHIPIQLHRETKTHPLPWLSYNTVTQHSYIRVLQLL